MVVVISVAFCLDERRLLTTGKSRRSYVPAEVSKVPCEAANGPPQPQPSSPYSGPRPTNPKPLSDWTTKRVPLNVQARQAWHGTRPAGERI
jgi:hypothetical protein